MTTKKVKVINTLIIAGQPHGPNNIVYSQQAIEDMAKNNPNLKVWKNKLKCMIELEVDEKYLDGGTNVSINALSDIAQDDRTITYPLNRSI